MFEGFTHHRIAAGDAEIDLLTAGDGPPVFLLHGFPQTRAAWHAVAPLLAREFTVIVPDLRGYGRSTGPVPGPEGEGYDKRAMAGDVLAVADALGFETFHVAGHDRGGRVAYRLALDQPERVRGLGILDIMPTLDMWESMSWQGALRAYHWPLLAQDGGFVTRLLGHDPVGYLEHLLARWKGRDFVFDPVAHEDYRAAILNPAVLAAMAADYRAGAEADIEHDRADRDAGRRIKAPVLLLRGSQYEARQLGRFWAPWAKVEEEQVYDCGHFLAEEEPEAVAVALADHFAAI